MKTRITAAGRRVTIYHDCADGFDWWWWEENSTGGRRNCRLPSLAAAVADAQQALGRDVRIMHSPEPS